MLTARRGGRISVRTIVIGASSGPGGRRRRPGDQRGAARTDLRAVLHDQGRRAGNGPRAVDLARHRLRARRLPRVVYRAVARRVLPVDAACAGKCGRHGNGSAKPRKPTLGSRSLSTMRCRFGASLARLLERRGYNVIEAASGDMALSMVCGGQALGLVVCDVRMPGMSGVDFFAQLCASRPELRGRFVFMSGDTAQPPGDELTKDLPVLNKPFTSADLHAVSKRYDCQDMPLTEVVIVGAARTPIGRYGGAFRQRIQPSSAPSAATRRSIAPASRRRTIDEVLIGHARQAGSGPNPGATGRTRAGFRDSVPAQTINKACASGMQADRGWRAVDHARRIGGRRSPAASSR